MKKTSTFRAVKKNEKELRKRLIIKAVKELFETNSFHGISMRNIAAQVGVSVAALYRYFPNRDNLFAGVLFQDIKKLMRYAQRRLKRKSSIEDLFLAVMDYLVYNESTFQIMCYFMIHDQIDPHTQKNFHWLQQDLLDRLEKAINTTNGFNGRHININALFASLVGIILTSKNYPDRTAEENRKVMHRLAVPIIRHQLQGVT